MTLTDNKITKLRLTLIALVFCSAAIFLSSFLAYDIKGLSSTPVLYAGELEYIANKIRFVVSVLFFLSVLVNFFYIKTQNPKSILVFCEGLLTQYYFFLLLSLLILTHMRFNLGYARIISTDYLGFAMAMFAIQLIAQWREYQNKISQVLQNGVSKIS